MATPLRWGMTKKKDLKTHAQKVPPANKRKWALEQKMEELVSYEELPKIHGQED